MKTLFMQLALTQFQSYSVSKCSVCCFFIVIVLLLGCRSNPDSQETFNEWIGKEVVIPRDTSIIKIKSLNHTDSNLLFRSNTLKLIISVDGECGSCIEKLKSIENFMDTVLKQKNEVTLLVYITSRISKFFTFELINDSILHFKYPIIYDYKNSYLEFNKYPDINNFSTVLCDKSGKIIFFGNIFPNKELEEICLNKIIAYTD